MGFYWDGVKKLKNRQLVGRSDSSGTLSPTDAILTSKRRRRPYLSDVVFGFLIAVILFDQSPFVASHQFWRNSEFIMGVYVAECSG